MDKTDISCSPLVWLPFGQSRNGFIWQDHVLMRYLAGIAEAVILFKKFKINLERQSYIF